MIRLADISKTYRLGSVDVCALRGVSLHIGSGEFVAIMGPSGSGKSTLMHILGLLDVPDAGSYRLNGIEVSTLDEDGRADLRARQIGFVFQQFNLIPRTTARDNVALPLIYSNLASGITPESLLNRVGLGERMNHAPNELSGGQQQRVAIARALVNDPVIVMADEPTGNLDSASAAEILGILRQLHESGLTVVIVTHDPDVARSADRIITMKDGRIASDHSAVEGRREVRPGQETLRKAAEPAVRGLWGMRLRQILAMLRQAGRSLAASKTRAALSMLGVLIGVAAVIAVMALGAGTKAAIEDRISSMGANLLVLMPQFQQNRGVALGAGGVSRLTLDDADAIRNELRGVKYVSAEVRGSVQVTSDSSNWRTTLRGIEPAYEQIHSLKPQSGRFLSADEIRSRSRVAVIGLTVSKKLFGAGNPVGKTIRVNRDSFEVIGLLPDKGSTPFMDENDQVLIPVSTAMRRVLGEDYVSSIEIQIDSVAYTDYVELAAVALMTKRHRIPADVEDPFHVRNMADMQSMMTSTSNTMAVLLAGVGAISLLVGGIGIMNIMLVSVTERTREIGVRKAIGARRFDIMLQFLVESVVISAGGGVAGVIIGAGASLAMHRLAGWAVAVQPVILLVAFSFSAAVGIVFGLWPARRASRLLPIEALRYE